VVSPTSPLEAALDRLGDRWSLRLIEVLLAGPQRFNELIEAVPGIAPNILSDRLRRLERDALVTSRLYSEKPPRLEYRLTEDGRELAGVVRLLADWAARGTADAEPRRHEACGTPLEARWYCPTCAAVVDEAESSAELRF
jgi:DNA-binding HxlR family transcriptional regulator